MASVFIRATNTGMGFITTEDRLGFTVSNTGLDIYEVSGDYQAWVDRVAGNEIAKDEADRLIALSNSSVITMRQARLALLQNSYLDSVSGAVMSYPRDVQIEWEYATEVHRNNPLVIKLGASLNLTETQLDDLFIQAKAL